MQTVTIPSGRVRLPEVTAGVATVVRRYDKERAYVLHPDDFRRLAALEELAAAALATPRIHLSDAALAAHRDEDTAGPTITDPAALHALLDG